MKTVGPDTQQRISWLFILTVLFFCTASFAADEHGIGGASASLQVGCAPDLPVVHPGELVTLRTWVTNASGDPVKLSVRYSWSASIGNVAGSSVATWSIRQDTDVAKDGMKAMARLVVTHESLGEAICELFVYVAKPTQALLEPDRRASSKRRAFLLSDASAPMGYGLYSYLLFDTRPRDNEERERHLKAIESYLLILEPMVEMERHRRLSEINIMLLPLEREVPLPANLLDPQQVGIAAQRVLEAYDYRRAHDLLAVFGEEAVRSGPYLVATLAVNPAERKPRLLFNMSHVVPRLVWDWVKSFTMLTTQERSWNQITLTKLSLNTRNFLAVAAQETPDVVSSLKEWVKVLSTK